MAKVRGLITGFTVNSSKSRMDEHWLEIKFVGVCSSSDLPDIYNVLKSYLDHRSSVSSEDYRSEINFGGAEVPIEASINPLVKTK